MIEGEAFRQQVAKALPSHLKPDRFIRVALTTMMRTPKLAECDQASFFNALLTLSQLGIEPDGRRAHLIPFKNTKRNLMECQLIVDYKGLAELAMRSGVVSNLHADVVCENDTFEYDCGEVKAHRIDFRKPRGAMYAAYAICRFKDGTAKAEVMGRDEIDAVRQRSRAGNNGPWVSDYSEMSKKTVFRRLSKWLPLSAEFRDAIEADDDEFVPIEETRPINGNALVEVVQNFEPETVDAVQEEDNVNMGDPEPEVVKETVMEQPPQAKLADVVINAGKTFDDFQRWCVEGGSFPGCDSFSKFSEIPTAEAKRLLLAKGAIVKALKP